MNFGELEQQIACMNTPQIAVFLICVWHCVLRPCILITKNFFPIVSNFARPPQTKILAWYISWMFLLIKRSVCCKGLHLWWIWTSGILHLSTNIFQEISEWGLVLHQTHYLPEEGSINLGTLHAECSWNFLHFTILWMLWLPLMDSVSIPFKILNTWSYPRFHSNSHIDGVLN